MRRSDATYKAFAVNAVVRIHGPTDGVSAKQSNNFSPRY
jgi:hypothetical protein